jgi:RND family efflux transporter MFP subunit
VFIFLHNHWMTCFDNLFSEKYMLEPTKSNLQQDNTGHSGSSGGALVNPNKALLATITIVSFFLLIVLMVFSGNQSALALVEDKLLVIQQSKVEVSTIKMQTAYTKPRVVYGQIGSVQQSDIGFELSGTVNQVVIIEGASVIKGQVLATLDIARLKARENELKSALVSANANAKLANLSAQRVMQLVQKNLEPQQRLDEVQAQLDASNAAASEVKARLDSLKVELAKSSLLAPFDGQVVRQYLDAGTVVTSGQAVFSILAEETLEARLGLPEQTAFGLTVGEMRQLAMHEQTFMAEVTSVAKQRSQATRTIEAVFTINTNDLSAQQKALMVSGDLVSLTVDIAEQTSGAWVPISALASGVRGLWTLYVVDANNIIQTRLVSIDFADKTKAYVSGAVNDGEQVVVSGIHRLVPQQTVTNVVEVDNQFVQTIQPAQTNASKGP